MCAATTGNRPADEQQQPNGEAKDRPDCVSTGMASAIEARTSSARDPDDPRAGIAARNRTPAAPHRAPETQLGGVGTASRRAEPRDIPADAGFHPAAADGTQHSVERGTTSDPRSSGIFTTGLASAGGPTPSSACSVFLSDAASMPAECSSSTAASSPTNQPSVAALCSTASRRTSNLGCCTADIANRS